MTALLSPDEQSAIVGEVARAPSVHNIQPARWRFDDDGSVILFRALDRTIPVADPTGHDLQVSLGAAFEGMAIALSTRGFAVGAPDPETRAAAAGCAPVLRARVSRGGDADPLAPWILRRRSFRGRFLSATADDVQRLAKVEAADARLLVGSAALSDLASRNDAAAWTFESRPEYHAELWSWLRLSPSHPRYHRDGLNADCLALSRVERWVAARLLEPHRFGFLTKLGLARHLISEAPQVRSAAAAIVFCPRRDETPFDVGRRMYRLWLEITAAGFWLAPMSASADDTPTRAAMERRAGVPSDRRVANVFRVGRANAADVAESPRLPVNELLV